MSPRSFHLEKPPDELCSLVPGRVVLPKVPLFDNVIEIGTPTRRPLITLDVAVETDLIEVRRSDNKPFNVNDYRGGEGEIGPIKAHKMLSAPVLAVLVSRDTSSNWWIDGRGLEVVDPITAQSFIQKIAEVANQEQGSI